MLTAVNNEKLMLPGGAVKIGQFEYEVNVNRDLKKVSEFNDLHTEKVGNTIINVRDVVTVRDGFQPQTNIVIKPLGGDWRVNQLPKAQKALRSSCEKAPVFVSRSFKAEEQQYVS